MSVRDFVHLLGDEINDHEEETFLLFSQSIPSQNLGFVNAKASVIDITVAGQDLAVHQSPTILSSKRKEGTTGAVLWKITPLLAGWIACPENVLFQNGILGRDSNVIELGCGISGIVGLALAPLINTFIATDQEYVMKLLRQNIEENSQQFSKSRKSKGKKRTALAVCTGQAIHTSNIQLLPLDWELHSPSELSSILGKYAKVTLDCSLARFDAVIGCDCIYNEALISPFVRTCSDICNLREKGSETNPTLCIIAQQLRSAEIFETWLVAFHKHFQVWRVPDELLTEGLRANTGFVVHVGMLREETVH